MIPYSRKRQNDEENSHQPQEKVRKTMEPVNQQDARKPMTSAGQLLPQARDRFQDMNNYTIEDPEPVYSQELPSSQMSQEADYSQFSQVTLQNRSLAMERQLALNKIRYDEAQARINELKAKKKLLEQQDEEIQQNLLSSSKGSDSGSTSEMKLLRKRLERANAENAFLHKIRRQRAKNFYVPLQYPNQSVFTESFKQLRHNSFDRPVAKYYNLVTCELEVPKKLQEYLNNLQLLFFRFKAAPRVQKENYDYCLTVFQQLFPAFRDLCEWIQSDESKIDIEVFTRNNYKRRQVLMISKQLIDDMIEPPKNAKADRLLENEGYEKENFKMLGLSDKLLDKKIKLIAMFALFAGESSCLSEIIAGAKISHVLPDENQELYSCTVLDLLTKAIVEDLIPLRKNFEYRGFIHALSLFAVAISQNYENLTAAVDESLSAFFKILLAVATNNADVLIKLTEFTINVGKVLVDNRLLAKLCVNCKMDEIIRSKIQRLIEVPLTSCHFMILFQLILNVFPQYYDVAEHRVKTLLELIMNINKVAYIFLVQANNIECLKAISTARRLNQPTTLCHCLKGLIFSLVTLNTLVAKNNFTEHPKYRRQSLECLDTFVTMLNEIFKKNALTFHLDEFILHKLQFIYFKARYTDDLDEEKKFLHHSEMKECPRLWKKLFVKPKTVHEDPGEVKKNLKGLLYDGIQKRKKIFL